MALFIRKNKSDILREALRKLEIGGGITATSPGSVARAFTEAITNEIADYYDALDFQVAQSVISTASGRALDLLGDLYEVKRKTVNDLVATDAKIGAFYFYMDSPYTEPITIPNGTRIYTSAESFVGTQLTYRTSGDTIIPVGEVRAFASIVPEFSDAIYTAAPNTLISNSLVSPPGAVVRCINPKAIPAQPGFESDDNYRIRIAKSIRVNASGTADAVRFAALGIAGVRDVKIIENKYGLGSFQMVITPEDVSLTQSVADELNATIKATRPVGVRIFVQSPTFIPVDVSATVIVKTSARVATDVLSNRVNVTIRRYLNSLLAGDALVYNRLIQYILDVSGEILDVQITRFAPNGIDSLRRNFTPQKDEILVPGRLEIGIASQ